MIKFDVKLTEAEVSNFVDILTKNPVLINKVTDSVYSSGKNEFNVEWQMPHARYLEFKHPITGKELKLEAPIPKYFEEVLKNLKNRELKD